ncbi:MAG TPA: hypothetical protein VFO42_06560 [Sphingomicrobium sp.]|nr:hypothetical protein [Sphingomicrobium sp.]
MTKFGLAGIVLAALAASAAQAQATPVERFVLAVQNGQDLAKSEFAELLAPGDAAKLAKIAKCVPGKPRTSASGSSMVVMWDCSALPGVGSLGVMFSMTEGKITSLFVMPAVVVPVNERG